MGSCLPHNTEAKKKGFIPAAVDLNVAHGGSPEQSNSNWNLQGRGDSRARTSQADPTSDVSGVWNQQHKNKWVLAGKASLLWVPSYLA